MGLFNKETNCVSIADDLEPKNGKMHCFLIHTMINNGNKPESAYTNRINSILEEIQNSGYQVLDIKLAIGGTQNLSYETLITYK